MPGGRRGPWRGTRPALVTTVTAGLSGMGGAVVVVVTVAAGPPPVGTIALAWRRRSATRWRRISLWDGLAAAYASTSVREIWSGNPKMIVVGVAAVVTAPRRLQRGHVAEGSADQEALAARAVKVSQHWECTHWWQHRSDSALIAGRTKRSRSAGSFRKMTLEWHMQQEPRSHVAMLALADMATSSCTIPETTEFRAAVAVAELSR